MENIFSALSAFSSLSVWVALVLAVPIGLVCGLMPGMSGITTLALIMPLAFTMDPTAGLVFLLAAHAVVYTGGSVTAILFAIPGAPANAATITDGHQFTLKGQSEFAIGAAITASCLGGVFGFICLLALIPAVRGLLPHIGSPEIFFLALLGLTFAASIDRDHFGNGLMAAAFGLLCGTIGYQLSTGIPRFWLNMDPLLDGLPLVPLATGLFAGPALFDMARGKVAIPKKNAAYAGAYSSAIAGFWACIKRPMLVLKASAIGTMVGIVPGVGGDTAPFVAYAWLKKSRHAGGEHEPSIAGVIAPESSNNAKEGGALVPTLALGIPGSAGMALLIGGFDGFGVEVGSGLLQNNLPLVLTLAFALAIANILGSAILITVLPLISRVATWSHAVLVPVIFSFAVLGVLSVRENPFDLVLMAIFAILGIAMAKFNFSRAAFLLGFVLSALIETSFHISLAALGPLFFLRPVSIVIAVMIIFQLIRVFRFKPD